jgi:hypothetical protein
LQVQTWVIKDGHQKEKKKSGKAETRSGSLLVKTLKEVPNKVKSVISASAIGLVR